jgi:hypothetical protein
MVGGYGLCLIEGVAARLKLVTLLLMVSVVGLLALLAPGSPFSFLVAVFRPWGGYVLSVMLSAVGTFALCAAMANKGFAVSYLRIAAITASSLAVLTWGLALGSCVFLFSSK